MNVEAARVKMAAHVLMVSTNTLALAQQDMKGHSARQVRNDQNIESHLHSLLLHLLVNIALIICVIKYCNLSLDINECGSSPCQNGGTCVDGVNQYTCTCAAGYEGTLCQTSKK